MTSTTSTAPSYPQQAVQAPAQAAVRKGNVFVGAAILIILTLLVAEIDKWIGSTFKADGIASTRSRIPADGGGHWPAGEWRVQAAQPALADQTGAAPNCS